MTMEGTITSDWSDKCSVDFSMRLAAEAFRHVDSAFEIVCGGSCGSDATGRGEPERPGYDASGMSVSETYVSKIEVTMNPTITTFFSLAAVLGRELLAAGLASADSMDCCPARDGALNSNAMTADLIGRNTLQHITNCTDNPSAKSTVVVAP